MQSACFAIAGPVTEAHARLTNLKWEGNANVIARHFNFSQVIFLNDFEAVWSEIEALTRDNLTPLQQGQSIEHGTKLVIGASTGLGVAHLNMARMMCDLVNLDLAGFNIRKRPFTKTF